VAKYYVEHVCLCVCLPVHEDICGTTHAIFTNFFVDAACGHGPVLLRQGDKIPGEGAVLGVFFPYNALYSIALGTHTKTAEPIEMLFGMMTQVFCRYHVMEDPIFQGEGTIFEENVKKSTIQHHR